MSRQMRNRIKDQSENDKKKSASKKRIVSRQLRNRIRDQSGG